MRRGPLARLARAGSWGACALALSSCDVAAQGDALGRASASASSASGEPSGPSIAGSSVSSLASAPPGMLHAPAARSLSAASAVVDRLIEPRFVRVEGAGAERRTVFSLALPTPRPTRLEAWVFYYDGAGRMLRRARERLDLPRDAPASLELALGLRGALSIPREAVTFEAEITRVATGSGRPWQNLNLLAPWAHERPPGGPSRATLEAHAGERLVLTARGGLPREPDGRVTFDVESVSPKAVRGAAIFVHFVDREGRRVGGVADYLGHGLEPRARLTVALGPRRAALPAAAVALEAGAYDVLFADGTRFTNDNLAATEDW